MESQRPEELPVDLTAEMHVKGADAGTVEYRRWLISIANGQLPVDLTAEMHVTRAPSSTGAG